MVIDIRNAHRVVCEALWAFLLPKRYNFTLNEKVAEKAFKWLLGILPIISNNVVAVGAVLVYFGNNIIAVAVAVVVAEMRIKGSVRLYNRLKWEGGKISLFD